MKRILIPGIALLLISSLACSVPVGRREAKRSFKTMAGKAIRAARKLARSVEQSADQTATESYNKHEEGLAYPWLNSILTRLVNEHGWQNLRPNYTWGVLQAAHLARNLGINRISVIEFGVAGGNGLVSLEKVAEKVEQIFDMEIDVYGFDTGSGLPKPEDYRDLPNLWLPSAFAMDVEKLKRHLARAQLVLGPVRETISGFIASRPAPVAFIAFDLDYYSSTMDAFKLLEANQQILLPRIYCYFDDIMGHCYSDFTGERLAIREFNSANPMRKISPIYGLKYFLPEGYKREVWSEMFYLAHIFDHDRYSEHDGLVKPSRSRVTELQVNGPEAGPSVPSPTDGRA